jgi:aldose 1-epimerase
MPSHKPLTMTSAVGLAAAAILSWGAAAAAAEVKVAPYGVTKTGKPVMAYTLVNDKGASATVLDYGGTVTAIRVPDRNGKLGNVVMSFQDLATWEANGYANAIAGRYAGSITKGFTLDGVYYPLVETAQGMTMHGGVDQYSHRVWTVEPIKKADGASVTLTLDSPDGDQGFPGRLKVSVKYSFTNDNSLRLDFTANTDKDTILNLMNHICFNLNGNSTTSVYDQELQIMTDQAFSRTPGKVADSVVGTAYDFTKPQLMGPHIVYSLGPQYDDPATSPPIPAGMVRGFSEPYMLRAGDNDLKHVVARMHDPVSGRVLELKTTEISIQAFFPGPSRPGVLSDVGKPLARGAAISLETQHPGNSPNRPEFPTTELKPDQTFHSSTIFTFSTDAKS